MGRQERARFAHQGHPGRNLLSAVTGAGHTITQLRFPDKTNEITGFVRLLTPFDLAGTARPARPGS